MQGDFLTAVKQGDRDRVQALLEHDALLLNTRDEHGISALMWSVYHRQSEMTALLLSRAPQLDVFEAAAVGDLAAVRQHLADAPEHAQRHASDGFSALGLAAFFGHLAIVELLLAAGADPSAPARNTMQVTPLHSAIAHGNPETARALAQLLLAHGADVNVAQAGGWTPLHQAAAHGHVDVVAMLLAHGADPNAGSADGRKPIDLARAANHLEAVALLEPAQR